MMNIKVVFLFVLFASNSAITQDKRDYQWFLGSDQQIGIEIRALKFDFNNQPFAPELRDKGLNFDQNNVSICNKDGELLLYSNGCAIANREHEVMMNGDGINNGEFFDDFWYSGSCRFGYPGTQDMLILQDPAEEEGYYVIHKKLERGADGGFDILSLTYSYVDLALDGGLGAVTEKNVDFYTIDKFLWSYLTAINHSNGEDWWLINPGADSKFYTFSIDNDGLNLSSVQNSFHDFDPDHSSAAGDAKFSPDGTMYAYFNHDDGLLLYNFDRETGLLSDVRKLAIAEPEQLAFATCEWSSNSEFLYLATRDSLWQVEVAFEDLENGKVFIAEHNGINDPFSTQFFKSTLGPDCRIYIRPGSSSYSFHVIHKPNKKGTACDLVQQGISLPEVSSTGSFPNFPRFRVDEEEKCDPSILTVLGEAVYWRRDLKMYPNPATALITIEIPDDTRGDLFVLDMEGQMVFHQQGFSGDKLDVSFLSSGVYSLEYVPENNKERVIYTERLIKVD
ncbi:MAG: hypothetical protein ACJATI_005270 [Halioglobus sp.]|jgi:hypothetical protein